MYNALPRREIEIGDLVRLGQDLHNAWSGETATVVALYPDYDKLEVAFDRDRSAILYGSDENLTWERFEPARVRRWRIA
jgi:hypothetical protein